MIGYLEFGGVRYGVQSVRLGQGQLHVQTYFHHGRVDLRQGEDVTVVGLDGVRVVTVAASEDLYSPSEGTWDLELHLDLL